ncbi:MFS transporter [Arthrobacter sp. NPDC080031]|uniref:MFS transporter n=1 Tax=Arthrobacter sp. NPDC080031 TaxID=3155918 RepID=UPI00344FC9CB
MSHTFPTPARTLDPAILRTVKLRLIPFLVLMFYINFLDRTNVSFAQLSMGKDLGLGAAAFGLGAGLFFIGYFIFEVPSNLALHKFGARIWLSRIMVSWGIVATLTALVQGEASFYIARVLLGIAEAGFFPGVILYLTYWFPRAQRARVLALFYLSIPLASSTGGLLSGWILNSAPFLKNWQFLYIAEGLPAIIVGVIAFFVLTDRPSKARWLTPVQRAELTEYIEAEDAAQPSPRTVSATFRSPRVLVLAVCYAGLNFGIYGVTFFLPQVIKAFNPGGSTTVTGLINAIPFAITGVAMLFLNRSSDRTGKPVRHIVIPLIVGALALAIVGTVSPSPVWLMAAVTLALFGVIATLPSFWKFTTATLAGVGAAAAVGMINAVGNLGSFAGPYAIGLLFGSTGSYDLGWVIIGVVMLLAAGGIGVVAVLMRTGRPESEAVPAVLAQSPAFGSTSTHDDA